MPDAPNESKWPLHKRRDKLRKMLRRDHPEVGDEMKHLDDGTPEQAYWHYGYMMALHDILALASGHTGKTRLIEELAQTPVVTEEPT